MYSGLNACSSFFKIRLDFYALDMKPLLISFYLVHFSGCSLEKAEPIVPKKKTMTYFCLYDSKSPCMQRLLETLHVRSVATFYKKNFPCNVCKQNIPLAKFPSGPGGYSSRHAQYCTYLITQYRTQAHSIVPCTMYHISDTVVSKICTISSHGIPC